MGLEPTYYGFADRYLTNSAHIHVIWRPVSLHGVGNLELTPKWDFFLFEHRDGPSAALLLTISEEHKQIDKHVDKIHIKL